jgi:rhomboid protease GluP
MNTYLLKLKHILPRFFILTLSLIFGLYVVRWYFSIHLGILDLKQEWWDIIFPVFLPFPVVMLGLRSKLKILGSKYVGDPWRMRMGFQYITILMLIPVVAISQAYLTTYTGKLTVLDTVDQIENTEKTRYYNIAHFDVVPSSGGAHSESQTFHKRYSSSTHLYLFFVTPMTSDPLKKLPTVPLCWYGVEFDKDSTAEPSAQERKKEWDTFYQESLVKMENYNFHSLGYFENIPNSAHRDRFLKAVEARIQSPAPADTMILEPHPESFTERNGNKLLWMGGIYASGVLLFLFALMFPSYKPIHIKNK